MHGRGRGRRQQPVADQIDVTWQRRQVLAGSLAAAALAGCGGEAVDRNALPTARNDVAGALARVEVRPGLWEVTREIVSASQPGLPVEIAERMKGRRSVRRHCITPEQAARPDGNFLAGGVGGRCTHSGFSMEDGRVSGEMLCRDPGGIETRARMSGSYGPERFEIGMEMETPGIGGETMAVVARQSGRRVGECGAEGEQKS